MEKKAAVDPARSCGRDTPPPVTVASQRKASFSTPARSGAPPIYRPFASTYQLTLTGAPPVYRPVTSTPQPKNAALAAPARSGAPPVYRPVTSTPQPKNATPAAPACSGAPTVYLPQQVVRPLPAGPPPVYRPRPTTLRSPASGAGAPPEYRPQQVALRSPVKPVAAVVQRAVKLQQAVAALETIMADHDRKDWYQANWPDGVKAIANEVAEREDTDKDNLKSRLQSHPKVSAELRGYRMLLEVPVEKKTQEWSADERAVYEAVLALSFYHVSKSAEAVRASGLDPQHGGKEGGISDERSVGGQREKNIKGSKGKVFVTRKWSEAKQYAEGDESRVIRVIIPEDKLDQGSLQVDPDSMFGLSHNIVLKGMDVRYRQLDWWASMYVAEYLTKRGKISARNNLATIYPALVEKGAFLTPPGKPEEKTLPKPITEAMDEEAAFRLAKLKYAS